MTFSTGQELIELCIKNQCAISSIMKYREFDEHRLDEAELNFKLSSAWQIMQNAAKEPLINPRKSIGGLIGGEAKSVMAHQSSTQSITGTLLSKIIAYSLAVLEVNASMGLIVAAPTAGSSGVLPSVLLALQEEKDLSESTIFHGLLNASAIGCLIMSNASVSGAEAGCQAEIGTASAMAASASVEMMDGSPAECLNAASLAISNLLGLVCDPIAGLVEAPCQSRNTIGAVNAITCAEMSLSGVNHPIPFDEMVAAMYRVGKSMPVELRETALGGNAATPTACTLGCGKCRRP